MPVGFGAIKAVTSGTGEDWTTRLKTAKPGAVAKDVLALGGIAGLPSIAELTGITIRF